MVISRLCAVLILYFKKKETIIKMAEKKVIGKGDIVDMLAENEELKHFEMTKADIRRVMNAFYDLVSDELIAGSEVRITGFGKFEVRHHKARTGRSPQDGSVLHIPASLAPAFKPARALKEAVNHK